MKIVVGPVLICLFSGISFSNTPERSEESMLF